MYRRWVFGITIKGFFHRQICYREQYEQIWMESKYQKSQRRTYPLQEVSGQTTLNILFCFNPEAGMGRSILIPI